MSGRLIAPNMGLSLNTGALLPWATDKMFSRYEDALKALGKRFKFQLSTPLEQFSEDALSALFYGEDEQGPPRARFAGPAPQLDGRQRGPRRWRRLPDEHFSDALRTQGQVA